MANRRHLLEKKIQNNDRNKDKRQKSLRIMLISIIYMAAIKMIGRVRVLKK